MSTTATGEDDYGSILDRLDFEVECSLEGDARFAYCSTGSQHSAALNGGIKTQRHKYVNGPHMAMWWVKFQCGHDLLVCGRAFGALIADVKAGQGPKCLDKSCSSYYAAIIDNKRL